MKVVKFFKKSALNFSGWRSNKRIVVLESDDWGAIRMPSVAVFENLKSKGFNVEKCPYSKFDTLEDSVDLERLFEVLLRYKDRMGKHAAITANTIVGNPDFPKIRDSGFGAYFYRPFYESYYDRGGSDQVIDLWRLGIEKKIFHPQFHGREHVNVPRWLRSLQSGSEETKFAFDNNFYAVSDLITKEDRRNFMPSFDYDSLEDFELIETAITEGLELFEKIFHFKSASVIAPAYTWSDRVENVLNSSGVKYLQGNPFQKISFYDQVQNRKKIYRYLGQSNTHGQRYLIRNAYFEPTILGRNGGVDNCLADIRNAFLWNKPAIIGSHRLNFIGGLSKANRDNNLILLDKLLSQIVSTWPDVEFYTSDMLGKEIAGAR